MTAFETFQAEKKIVNNSQHDGLVDAARTQPNLESKPRAAALAPAQLHSPAPGNITDVLKNALDGDTIQLAAGQYTSNTVSIRPINIKGAEPDASGWLRSFLTFNTGAIAISAAANTTIDAVMMTNNSGLINFPNGTGMARITRCGLKYDGSGSNAVGIRSLNGNPKLVVDRCYFHDSPNSYRDMDLYGQGDVNLTNNEFEGTNYGSHVDGPKTGTVTITGNVGTKWNRNMGIECQDHNAIQGSGKLIFSGNCFYGFGPGITNNTYGVSIPVQNTGACICANNYICLGDWDASGNYHEAPLVGGSNVGIGLELGSGPNTTIATGNTIIGSFCVGIVTCQPGTSVSGNKVYGRKASGSWGNVAFSGEPGNHNGASFIPADPSKSNSIIETIDGFTPRPPRRVTRQPWASGVTPPPPDNPMAKIIAPVPGTKLSPGKVILTIDGSVTIDLEGDGAGPDALKPTVAAQSGSVAVYTVTIPVTATAATALKVLDANGAEIGRFPIVIPVTAQGDFHVEEISSFDIVNGKEVNASPVKRIITQK